MKTLVPFSESHPPVSSDFDNGVMYADKHGVYFHAVGGNTFTFKVELGNTNMAQHFVNSFKKDVHVLALLFLGFKRDLPDSL